MRRSRDVWIATGHPIILEIMRPSFRHYRRHTGYRPFKCAHCTSDTRFARSDHLRSHIKNRHPSASPN